MGQEKNRQSIRLKGYDYAQHGAYFVTICTFQRLYLFGDVVNGVMQCNEWGQIAEQELYQTAKLRTNVEIDAFVIMPNHVHAIIMIVDNTKGKSKRFDGRSAMHCASTKRGTTSNNVIPNSLGAIVRGYKATVTGQINRLPETPEDSIWQRNYYDHIIRNEKELNYIRQYVDTNPTCWEEDKLYGGNKK